MNREEELQNLVDKLKKIKEESGATYEQLARAIGVSTFTLPRWFSRGMYNPNTSSIKLVTNFISDYERSEKEGRSDTFFPMV